jgi:hypothetical protein
LFCDCAATVQANRAATWALFTLAHEQLAAAMPARKFVGFAITNLRFTMGFGEMNFFALSSGGEFLFPFVHATKFSPVKNCE